MYKLALLIIMFLTSQLNAQTETKTNTNFEKGMTKALALWESNPADAVNLFERIASAEPDNWLPPYYAAMVLITGGFSENNMETVHANLNRAQNFLNDATAISKENSEIMVLQAMLHTVYVVKDGAKYGMTLSPKIAKIYEEAYKLSPKNPRVLLSKTQWDMGAAKFFGQDTKPFCKDIEKAIELFTNFKPETSLHPKWGMDGAKKALAECKL